MKKTIVYIITLVFLFLTMLGCASQESPETPTSQESTSMVSSTVPKDEAELVLEQTLWQVNDQSTYLLFHDGKQVSEYDLSLINGENEEIEKCLSYSIEDDKNTGKTVYFPYLLGNYDIYMQYSPQEKSIVVKDNVISLQKTSMKNFVQAFSEKIQKVDTNDKWETQAEMNVAVGVRCNYWDTLYQAVDRYLKATLPSEEYLVFEQETKAFEARRTNAMEEAGNSEQEGSLYPMVTGGAYCNQTQKEIQTILTKYFS